MTDSGGHRVLGVTEDRTTKACDQRWKTLSPVQCQMVESVSVGMWPEFMNRSNANAPKVEIVHDGFLVSKNLNEAVDKVCRRENRELQSEGDNRLKGTRQSFLYSVEKLDEDSYFGLLTLQEEDIKTGRAWSIKENFHEFWNYRMKPKANCFFGQWCIWAIRSRRELIKKGTRMLKNHLEGLLSYSKYRVPNSISEVFNNRIHPPSQQPEAFATLQTTDYASCSTAVNSK